MDLIYFSLAFIIVNLDTCIVRTEGVNDTPDVEMTETPTDVFDFSLNDNLGVRFDSLNLLADHPTEMFIFQSSYSGV